MQGGQEQPAKDSESSAGSVPAFTAPSSGGYTENSVRSLLRLLQRDPDLEEKVLKLVSSRFEKTSSSSPQPPVPPVSAGLPSEVPVPAGSALEAPVPVEPASEVPVLEGSANVQAPSHQSSLAIATEEPVARSELAAAHSKREERKGRSRTQRRIPSPRHRKRRSSYSESSRRSSSSHRRKKSRKRSPARNSRRNRDRRSSTRSRSEKRKSKKGRRAHSESQRRYSYSQSLRPP